MWIPDPLYNNIKKKFPIPCVDLIVKNEANEILLVKRVNQPAKGEWWFPGGRVNHGELRIDAAKRKLKEECGLNGNCFKEWNTIEIFLNDTDENYLSHGISTIYIIEVKELDVVIDHQSSTFMWKHNLKWQEIVTNSFLKGILVEFSNIK